MGNNGIDFTSDKLITQPIVHLFNLFIVILFCTYLKKSQQIKIIEFETHRDYNKIEYYTIMVTNLSDHTSKEEVISNIKQLSKTLDIQDVVFCYDVEDFMKLKQKK
jgi:hypothetical protein